MDVLRNVARLVLISALGLSFSFPVHADPRLDQQFPPDSGTDSQDVFDTYRQKLSEIQAELAALGRPVPSSLSLAGDGLAFYLDAPYVAQYHTNQRQQRFVLGRIVVLNKTNREVTFNPRKIVLDAGGQKIEFRPVEDFEGYTSFQRERRHYSLSELQVPEQLTAPAGQVASSWVVFNGLPAGTSVPPLKLLIPIDGKTHEFDMSLFGRAQLKWRRETIGPRDVLALTTIHGEVNPLNLATIVDDMTELAVDDVARVIMHFDKEAAAVDPHLLQWFATMAVMAGRESTNQPQFEFPSIPPLISEVHLSSLPDPDHIVRQESVSGPARSHEDLLDAMLAATHGIYESIPLNELIAEIRSGHRLSRYAALVHGAMRLPAGFWSEIAEILNTTDDPALQRAALIALGEFPDPQAVTLLKQSVRSADNAISEAALSSLGSSRFPVHHQALLAMLNESPEIQSRVIGTFAKYPRPEWSDKLYEFARTGNEETRIESLQALNTLGHPQLHDLLVGILKSDDKKLQAIAFEMLAAREDDASRQELIRFALKRIEAEYPDRQSLQAIAKYRVQAAVPTLLGYLEQENSLRDTLINTLAKIGDNRIVEPLLTVYPELEVSEQEAVLRAVGQIDQNSLLDFAPNALLKEDQHLTNVLVSLLQGSTDERAVDVLIALIEKRPEDSPVATSLIRALGGFLSDRSRSYLIKVRDSDSEARSQMAAAALDAMFSRSPVNHIYQQAMSTLRQGDAALAVLQFSLVLDFDSDFPHAIQGRGLAYQHLDQYDQALADFEHLLSIDPRWPSAQGTVGQILISMYRFEDARPYFDRAISQDPKKAVWYSSRGHVNSMLERFPDAEADYRRALELDPELMTAITGVALSLAINGKVDEAVEQLKRGRVQHGDDAIFAYNAACTYTRAAEYLSRHANAAADQKMRIDRLVDSAFEELNRSVKQGYIDANWTRKDPDLELLHEDDRFAAVLDAMKKAQSEASNSR
ncbi:HEAT repeat domain-containing protein [Rubinisphaera margarita]|uniref:HEAT repeat domain-containing protein n=1 Tax=Rubinisphaera margarita TaxID=2909586 RepID=UPI001EE85D8C|nr:HEAT repeat domain-containing protein [Rubinisphaera margarita]MCG6155368.1 HEAT repeat domain-containing protein [Rubinisphaera margarita]